ncbi:MAG: cell division protein SepF, partial [Firmicutes bacterium]|nr:cell division protein SepF [Candidatus Caballimonas caccae]
MGLFNNFFSKTAEMKEDRNRFSDSYTETTKENISSNNLAEKRNPVSVFAPKSFTDVEIIINTFKEGKNAIVHLNDIKTETAIRILDMLSGAIYALGGGVYEMQKNIFMFSPNGVE